MHTTIDAGLAIYKNELADYVRWTNDLKKRTTNTDTDEFKNSKQFLKQLEITSEQLSRESRLCGMEMILGITEDEADNFLKEAQEAV